MTYKEKLIADHPEWTKDFIEKILPRCCPSDFGYPDNCDPEADDCDICCWEHEISEEAPTIDELHGEFNRLNNDLIKIQTDTLYGEMKTVRTNEESAEPHIKDSGDRTRFESGAVRDMREGKGRCDLMPLEVVAKWLKTKVLDCIAQFKIHGDTIYLYGAMNYFLDDAGWSYWEACLEVAKHFEEGAKKYGESNWQKGIPVHCYIDSALRHYFKFMCGMKDEPHDRAFVWNLMCCIWEVDYGEECRKSKEDQS